MEKVCLYAFQKIILENKLPTNDKIEIIEECIKMGVDINQSESLILLNAVRHQDYLLVKFLLDNGADIHAKNDEAIISACRLIKPEMVKLLIEHGADIKLQNNLLLVIACHYHNFFIIQYLVENGADCTHPNNGPIKELFLTAGGINSKKLLLDNGADPNAKYDNSDLLGVSLTILEARIAPSSQFVTPSSGELELSLNNFDYESCQLLFSYGADITLCEFINNENHLYYKGINHHIESKFRREEYKQKIIDLFMEYGIDLLGIISKQNYGHSL